MCRGLVDPATVNSVRSLGEETFSEVWNRLFFALFYTVQLPRQVGTNVRKVEEKEAFSQATAGAASPVMRWTPATFDHEAPATDAGAEASFKC